MTVVVRIGLVWSALSSGVPMEEGMPCGEHLVRFVTGCCPRQEFKVVAAACLLAAFAFFFAVIALFRRSYH